MNASNWSRILVKFWGEEVWHRFSCSNFKKQSIHLKRLMSMKSNYLSWTKSKQHRAIFPTTIDTSHIWPTLNILRLWAVSTILLIKFLITNKFKCWRFNVWPRQDKLSKLSSTSRQFLWPIALTPIFGIWRELSSCMMVKVRGRRNCLPRAWGWIQIITNAGWLWIKLKNVKLLNKKEISW